MNRLIYWLRIIERKLAAAESLFLVVVVALMLVLAVLQVLLKMAGAGIEQVEISARYLVVWIGFLGGAVATYQGRHINIEILPRFLKARGKRFAELLTNLCSFFLLVLLLVLSFNYVSDMAHEGRIAVEFMLFNRQIQLMGWWIAAIMPLGLFLMACHFLIRLLLVGLVTNPPEDGETTSSAGGSQ